MVRFVLCLPSLFHVPLFFFFFFGLIAFLFNQTSQPFPLVLYICIFIDMHVSVHPSPHNPSRSTKTNVAVASYPNIISDQHCLLVRAGEEELRPSKPVTVPSWCSKALWSCLWCRSASFDPEPFRLLRSGPFSVPCCNQYISKPSVLLRSAEIIFSLLLLLLISPGLQIDYTLLIFTSKVYLTPSTTSHNYI